MSDIEALTVMSYVEDIRPMGVSLLTLSRACAETLGLFLYGGCSFIPRSRRRHTGESRYPDKRWPGKAFANFTAGLDSGLRRNDGIEARASQGFERRAVDNNTDHKRETGT